MKTRVICQYASEENFEEAKFYLSPRGDNFIFVYKKNGQYFAQNKYEVFGGYTIIENVSFTPNGRLYSFNYASFKKIAGIIKDDNKEYLNINGREFGAFGKVNSFKLNNNSTYYLSYRDYFKTFINISKQKFGGFDKVHKVKLSEDGKLFAFHYVEGGKHFFRYNSSIYGEYDNIRNIIVKFDQELFAFEYKKGTEYYVNMNGNKYGPYLTIEDLSYKVEFKMFSCKYSTESGNYLQLNDKQFGPYEQVGSPYFSKANNFIHFNYLIDGIEKNIFILKGVGVYKDVDYIKHDESDAYFIITYTKSDDTYAILNDKTYGPYNSISRPNISSNGNNICFIFEKDGYEFVNISDSIYGPYEKVTEVEIGNDYDNFGFIYYKNKKYYVRIGSKVYGLYDEAFNLVVSSSGHGFSYNFIKRNKSLANMFKKDEVFTAIDGDIVKEYWEVLSYQKNDKGDNVIIYMFNGESNVYYNGNTYGPFYSIKNPQFLKNGDFAFRFTEDNKGLEHLQIKNKQLLSLNKYNSVFYPMFTNDKKDYGLIHYRNEKYFVQITDQEYGPYDFAVVPSFSEDSKIKVFKYMINGYVYFKINDTDYGPFGEGDYVFVGNKLYLIYLKEYLIQIDEFIEDEQINKSQNDQ